MFTLQHTSLTVAGKKEKAAEKRKDLEGTGSGQRNGTLQNKRRGSGQRRRMFCPGAGRAGGAARTSRMCSRRRLLEKCLFGLVPRIPGLLNGGSGGGAEGLPLQS